MTGVVKTPGIYGYNFPRVFSVGSGPNQSYSPQFDWGILSQYPTRKVKGITLESI